MTLSKESEQFLMNLRAYLMSSGKKEEEVKEIVEELESHLSEAEADGKSVEDIIGQSPKEYMQSIAGEMKTDRKGSLIAGLAIILGAFSISIFPDIVRGELTFSLFKLLGMLLVFLLFTGGIVLLSKRLSAENASDKKSILLISLVMVLPVFVFFGLFILDDYVNTPVISVKEPTVYIVGVIVAGFLIWISLWSKTWIIPLVVAILTLPEILEMVFQFSDEVTLYIFFGLLVGGSLFLYFVFRKSNK